MSTHRIHSLDHNNHMGGRGHLVCNKPQVVSNRDLLSQNMKRMIRRITWSSWHSKMHNRGWVPPHWQRLLHYSSSWAKVFVLFVYQEILSRMWNPGKFWHAFLIMMGEAFENPFLLRVYQQFVECLEFNFYVKICKKSTQRIDGDILNLCKPARVSRHSTSWWEVKSR